MSVLIKDMVIPETCDDCPFHAYHSNYEYVCKATPMLYPMNLANTKGIRKEWCPLIEQEDESCEGCKHLGKWENEVEYGYPSPCTRCKRRVGDHYER